MQVNGASRVDRGYSGSQRPKNEANTLSKAPPTPSVRGSRRRSAWNLLLPEEFGQVGPLQTEFGCRLRLIPPVPT